MARLHLPSKGRAVKQSPFDHLEREHGLVRRALAVLSGLADHVRLGGSFPTRDVETLLRFFTGFFQGVHEAKESGSLHPAVALHGNEREAELVGGLLRDHAETVDVLHSLRLFGETSGELADVERRGFCDAARTFAGRLTRLMHEEEERLFPIAQGCVPPDDLLTLLEVFHEVDSNSVPAATWEAALRELEAVWGS